jgi:hypothetical protein
MTACHHARLGARTCGVCADDPIQPADTTSTEETS